MSPWGLLLAVMLLVIAAIDFRTFRIPDWLSLPLIAAGLLRAIALGEAWPSHVIGAGVGYISLAVFGALYFRLRGRDGLGLGDAKLFAAAGAWLGWQALPLVLTVAAVAGLAFALVTRRHPAAQLAFGPWLALALWVGWLLR